MYGCRAGPTFNPIWLHRLHLSQGSLGYYARAPNCLAGTPLTLWPNSGSLCYPTYRSLTSDHHTHWAGALTALGILHLTEVEASIRPGDCRQVQGWGMGIFQKNVVLVPAIAELLRCLFGGATEQCHCLIFQDGPCWVYLDFSRCKNSIGHTRRVLDNSPLQSSVYILY